MVQFSVIVACALNGGIGVNNRIPWHIPNDLKHFKKVTVSNKDPELGLTNVVIMGRNTWQSLPNKPLPSRINIIVSSQLKSIDDNNVYVVKSLDDALQLVNSLPNVKETFVIGGSRLYTDALHHPNCTKAYVTHVFKHFDCDVRFPLDTLFRSFRVVDEGSMQVHNNLHYAFYTYLRM